MSILHCIEVVPVDQIPLEARSPKKPKSVPVVLVVDDERVIADTLSIILSRNGFTVLTAYDAASALNLAASVCPQLLLSDVMMGPGMDGIQLATEMMKSYAECKVILFSGHAATQDLLEKARERGHSFTVLSKPLHPAELLQHIEACLAPVTATASA
jgi:DNA-binding NtrC family response regulator